MIKLGILGSGKGSNFKALLEAVGAGHLAAEFALVASDVASSGILKKAADEGISCYVINEPTFQTRLSLETEIALARTLKEAGCDLIVLAGYMRMVKSPLLDAFPGRIINIHPSLLPKFPGLEAWQQALDAGETETGCTVHFVDHGMDTGEVIARERVPIRKDDTPQSLHARIQEAEHKLLPGVVAELCRDLGAGRPWVATAKKSFRAGGAR